MATWGYFNDPPPPPRVVERTPTPAERLQARRRISRWWLDRIQIVHIVAITFTGFNYMTVTNWGWSWLDIGEWAKQAFPPEYEFPNREPSYRIKSACFWLITLMCSMLFILGVLNDCVGACIRMAYRDRPHKLHWVLIDTKIVLDLFAAVIVCALACFVHNLLHYGKPFAAWSIFKLDPDFWNRAVRYRQPVRVGGRML